MLVLPTSIQPPALPLQPCRPYGGLESAPLLQTVYDVTYGEPWRAMWVWTLAGLRQLQVLTSHAPAVLLDELSILGWEGELLRRPGGPTVLALGVGKVHVPRVLQLLPPAEHDLPDYLTTCKAGLGEPSWSCRLPGMLELSADAVKITLREAERSEYDAAVMECGQLRIRCYMHDATQATHRVYLLGQMPKPL